MGRAEVAPVCTPTSMASLSLILASDKSCVTKLVVGNALPRMRQNRIGLQQVLL